MSELVILLTSPVRKLRLQAIRLARSSRSGLGALASLVRLLGVGLMGLIGRGSLGERLASRFAAPVNLRHALNVLRTFAPNLVLRRRVVTGYENSGTALVMRDEDVRDVLDRFGVFHVVYAPKMKKITGGGQFFLGMQYTRRYVRDVSNMRGVARMSDVDDRVAPFAASHALSFVLKSDGRIDVPQELTLPLLASLVGDYFGTPGPSERTMSDWATVLFWYLFTDLKGDPDLEVRALKAAAECRNSIDETIAARKANPRPANDVLGRCLEMQAAGRPGFADNEIRNNLIGLIIGLIPTISSASVQALNQLLDRPAELRAAQEAAAADDDCRLASYLFEAFRFDPLNPIIYRLATQDYVVAKGTRREKRIPKGTMVLASNLSAMFDPHSVPNPNEFRIDRPWSTYILFGYGLHSCFGELINRAVIPQILKPLLKQRNLRRAPGASGEMNKENTPFPVHMMMEFDPAP